MYHAATTKFAIQFEAQFGSSLEKESSGKKDSKERKEHREHKKSKKPKHHFVVFTNLPERNRPGRQWVHCDREKREISEEDLEKQLARSQEPGRDVKTLMKRMSSKQRRHLRDYAKRLNDDEDSDKYIWRIASLAHDRPCEEYDNVPRTMWAVYQREKNEKNEKHKKRERASKQTTSKRIGSSPERSQNISQQPLLAIPRGVVVTPVSSLPRIETSIPHPQSQNSLQVPKRSERDLSPCLDYSEAPPKATSEAKTSECVVSEWMKGLSDSDSSGSSSDNSSQVSSHDSSITTHSSGTYLRSILKSSKGSTDCCGCRSSETTSSSSSDLSSSTGRYTLGYPPRRDNDIQGWKQQSLGLTSTPCNNCRTMPVGNPCCMKQKRRTRFAEQDEVFEVEYEREYGYSSANDSDGEFGEEFEEEYYRCSYRSSALPPPPPRMRRDYDNAPLARSVYVEYL